MDFEGFLIVFVLMSSRFCQKCSEGKFQVFVGF